MLPRLTGFKSRREREGLPAKGEENTPKRPICGNNTKNLRFADPAHRQPLRVLDPSALIAAVL
jgi:hypothetical protein